MCLVIPGKAPSAIEGVYILLPLITKMLVIAPSAKLPLEFNKNASSNPFETASLFANIKSR